MISLIQGLPTVQFFDHLQYANGGGRPGPFYHVNDISVYLGRQRGGGALKQKSVFHLHILRPKQGVLCFSLLKHLNFSTWTETRKRLQACFIV